MSSNYQQKKMMNALGAIDTKGNIVLEQFQDGTALLFQPGKALCGHNEANGHGCDA